MTNDARTSDDIERDSAQERAQMSDTINDLQKKFSVNAITNDIGAMFRGQGGDIGRAVSDTLARNPTAVVLVGVGLAWLFLGQGRPPAAQTAAWPTGRSADRRRSRPASGGWAGRSMGDDRRTDGPFRMDDHEWYGEARTSGEYGTGDTDQLDGAFDPSGTQDAAQGVVGTLQDAASRMGDAVSDAAGTVGNAASDLTARLSVGLEHLSDEARARVLAARRAAHDARLSSQAALNRGARTATGMFEDQPLVVAALAVAFGAAVGGLLPHSKIEDDSMGNSSDQLFADAQSLFQEERAKAMAAVRMAASDAKGEIRDVGNDLADMLPEGKSLGDVIVNRAADAATRVFDRATNGVEHHDQDDSRT